ncbi:MAG: hypothetical protein WAT39_15460 [Planctomycetota bacterium]
MKVELTPKQQRMVQKWIATGRWETPDAVVSEALQQFEAGQSDQEQHVSWLRAALARSLRQAERGELRDGATVVREVRDSLRSKRQRRKQR